jgi:hypothetical protein
VGARAIQLTNNSYYDFYPQIYSGQVAWVRNDGNDHEIYLARPHKVEIIFDPETATYTAAEDNTIPVIITINGEETNMSPGETYTPPSREFTLQLRARARSKGGRLFG